MTIRLPLDIKSLYFNIKNDNEKGHTATVATPLRQGLSVHKEIAQIVGIPENINEISREGIVSKILSKSRAEAKITNVFVFNKISVNGEIIDNVPSYCVYIREEISPSNVHFGRQKVHYPYSFSYEDEYVDINNRAVMNEISNRLNNYAFIIEAFEYSFETGVLNFDAIIVGEEDIPYSKVFINKRGVGNKFTSHFVDTADTYDAEIIALREKLGYEKVAPDNYNDIMNSNALKAQKIVMEYLSSTEAKNIRNLREEYPYSLYDIGYSLDGKKRYVIVKYTSTKLKYFDLPMSKVKFCNDFPNSVQVFLISDINGIPKMHIFSINEMNNMSKQINSIRYKESDN